MGFSSWAEWSLRVRGAYDCGMSVPVEVEPAWAGLSQEEKQARVLDVADALFTREGLDISVPDLARAVGVGVGSLYRQVGKKDDLIAALLVRRAEAMAGRFRAAAAEADVAAALRSVVLAVVDACLEDRVLREAWDLAVDRPEVTAAHQGVLEAMRGLVARGRQAGVLRPDATEIDLRLMFRGAAPAEALQPGGARRLAELVLAGIST